MEMSPQLTVAGWTALAGLCVVQQRQLSSARRDPLTGLATRHLWNRRAERALRCRSGLVVVLVDGDGVKATNDTWGHAVGDALIRALGSRLRAWTGTNGLAARLGGDEFAAYVRLADVHLAARLDDLSRAMAAPVVAGGRQLPVTASIGAVLVDALTEDALQREQNLLPEVVPASVLRRKAALSAADSAMYSVKAAGGAAWRLADADVNYRRRATGLDAARWRSPVVSGRRRGIPHQTIIDVPASGT